MGEVIEIDECTEIVPQQGGFLRPAGSLDELSSVFKEYQELSHKLLDDSDYQVIQNKKFKKKSAWRKYAVAFNLSDKIVDKHFEHDDEGNILYAEFTVEVMAPNGRCSTGWGSCSNKERGFSKPGHDIPATGHTRAKNRAIADLVGFGEVSAEEVDGGEVWRDHKPEQPKTYSKPNNEPLTDPQRKMIFRLFTKLEWSTEKQEEYLVSNWLVKEVKMLSKPEASAVIKALKKEAGEE